MRRQGIRRRAHWAPATLLVAVTMMVCAGTLRGENGVSVPVGYARIMVPADGGRVLASLPFLPRDEDIANVLSGQLPEPKAAEGEFRVLKWDADTQSYLDAAYTRDGTNASWVAATVQGETTELTLLPGEAFWIENGSQKDHEVYVWGQVVLDESISLPFVPGMNFFSYPFSAAAGLDRESLPDERDALHAYAGEEYLVAQPSESDGSLEWHTPDGIRVDKAPALTMGSGYVLHRKATNETVWAQQRPYKDLFPMDVSSPAIASISAARDRGVAVTIAPAGAPGEKIDLYYQDLAPDQGFKAMGAWQVAALDIDPAGRDTVTWTEVPPTVPKDEAAATSFGRCYLAARSDIDTDGDGVPDAREVFVRSTDPNTPGGDGGETADEDASITQDSGSKTNFPPVVEFPRAGRTIYVSRQRGSDAFTGRLAVHRGHDGPKETIRAGMREASGPDRVVIMSGAYGEHMDVSGKNVRVTIQGDVDLSGKHSRRGGKR